MKNKLLYRICLILLMLTLWSGSFQNKVFAQDTGGEVSTGSIAAEEVAIEAEHHEGEREIDGLWQRQPQPLGGSERIIGGEDAEADAWPWGAALYYDGYFGNNFFCGGSLIAPEWIMTAAHCVKGGIPEKMSAVIGRTDLTTADGTEFSVDKILIHPYYSAIGSTSVNDIALLHLTEAATDEAIVIVTTDELDLAAANTLATVIGWGATSEDSSSLSDKLQQVSIPIVSNETCQDAYSYNTIEDSMICAGLEEGGKDACSGDSGGPLMVPNTEGDGWLQAGIVSWGYGCARPDYYGVHTRVSSFQPWIESCQVDSASEACQPRIIPQEELDALNALYNSTDGDNWNNSGDWATDATPCQWRGVTCKDAQVSSLVLYQNNLQGNLPASIGSLSNLKTLDLYDNHLTGSIPSELENLSELSTLYLSKNSFSGLIPPSLGNLDSLRYLHLSTNFLTGTLPPELGNLSLLRDLIVSRNTLHGAIPFSYTNLSSLSSFYFSGTEICVPQSDEMTTWLDSIYVYGNTSNICAEPPHLSLPEDIRALNNSTITVPINFESHGSAITSIALAIDYDESCLSATAVTPTVNDEFNAIAGIVTEQTDSEIRLAVTDVSAPLTSLNDGPLAMIEFDVLCNASESQPLTATLSFAANPAPSFGNVDGRSITGTVTSGRVTIYETLPPMSGDCTGDQLVDSVDILCLVLEIFDGDGNSAAETINGAYAGTPGADANQDQIVDAGDFGCTVMLILDDETGCGQAAGQVVQNAQRNSQVSQNQTALAEISLRSSPQTASASMVSTLTLRPQENQIGAMVFSLEYDASDLRFDMDDGDGNGVPDSIQSNLSGEFDIHLVHKEADGQGQVNLLVASKTMPPTALQDGAQVHVTFRQIDPASQVDQPQLSSNLQVSIGSVDGKSLEYVVEQSVDEVSFDEINGEGQQPHLYLPFLTR